MYPVPQSPAPVPAVPVVWPPHNTPDRKLCDAVKYASEDDFVPLMIAALQEGARIDATDAQGQNLLELAVQRNSVRIAQALIAWSAPIPVASRDRLDLLMHIARSGNADMAKLLMNADESLVDYVDMQGKTALHHAAECGATQVIPVLLEHDAEIDARAHGMSDAELTELFGPAHELHAKGITPLTVAVANGHIRTAELLLERGAEMTTGRANPLLIAVKKNDPAMLAMLIAHAARTGQLTQVVNQQVLECSLLGQSQTHLLRQILDGCRLSARDDIDLGIALLLAVRLGHVDQAACLMSECAQAGIAFHVDSELWEAAAELHDPTLLQVLTLWRQAQFAELLQPSSDGQPPLLTRLCVLAGDAVQLGINGVFECLIAPFVTELDDIANNYWQESPAQVAAKTAHALSTLLLKELPVFPRAPAPVTGNEPLIPAAVLLNKQAPVWHAQSQQINDAIAEQKYQILTLVISKMGTLPQALNDALSPDFLIQARQRALGGNDVTGTEFALWADMRETLGIPGPLAQLMASAWFDAEQQMITEAASSAQPDATALSRLMANTLYCKLQAFQTEAGSYQHRCKQVLLGILAAGRTTWQRLIRQPAEFLRALEERTGFRPVNVQTLTVALQQATGLPAGVCLALSTGWQQAVADAGRQRDEGLAGGRFHALDKAFAARWKEWLTAHADDAGGASLPLLADEFRQLLDWCEQMREHEKVSLKRKAVGEADGAPPHKPAKRQ